MNKLEVIKSFVNDKLDLILSLASNPDSSVLWSLKDNNIIVDGKKYTSNDVIILSPILGIAKESNDNCNLIDITSPIVRTVTKKNGTSYWFDERAIIGKSVEFDVFNKDNQKIIGVSLVPREIAVSHTVQISATLKNQIVELIKDTNKRVLIVSNIEEVKAAYIEGDVIIMITTTNSNNVICNKFGQLYGYKLIRDNYTIYATTSKDNILPILSILFDKESIYYDNNFNINFKERIDALESETARLQSNTISYRETIINWLSTINANTEIIKSLREIKEVDKGKLEADIMKFDKIQSVKFHNNTVYVYTDELNMTINGSIIPLGKMLLKFHNNGIIRAINLTRRVDAYCVNASHPHDVGDGKICFGNLETQIIDLFKTNLPLCVALVMTFLQEGVNTSDTAGRHYDKWINA